ncbi:hypothetical protein FQD73_023110 (plasmid) [Salmonella enterica subsp. enterica serovar Schwarzengrund]|nr:hypothetical protein FQD73_023110 [Salmonella enterica subsp. enterica serovar Schwarzengrund]
MPSKSQTGPDRSTPHRELHGKLKSITVTRSATGKYYASILCDDGASAPENPTYLKEEKITGLDMGLEHYAITSDAVKVPNPRHLINVSRNLRRKQKALSRKQKEARIVKRPESVLRPYTTGGECPC